MKSETPVVLKGTPQGLLLIPQADEWGDVMEGLAAALRDGQSFFRGARVIVELGPRELTLEQLATLREKLREYSMELWAVLSDNDASVRVARSIGILTKLPKESKTSHQKETAEAQPAAIFVQRTLRSGQSLTFPGDVTLLGDVNPGAEVVAGGNIIVWGRIRGLAHAGAWGDQNAIICALELEPSQLRIAGLIGRKPEGRRKRSQPEVARISEDRIVAEPWKARE
jgi:septum site-determining protein MinC